MFLFDSCEETRNEKTTYRSFHRKSDQMTETDCRIFLSFYQSMAMSNSPEQREMCAFNFPVGNALTEGCNFCSRWNEYTISTFAQAIVSCVGADGYERNRLHRILDAMAMDENKIVRRRIAGGLHEVGRQSRRICYESRNKT